MIILPFILNGQNLQKGENFPEVVERSANYLKMVVDGIPNDYSATAYFNLSWENNGKPYGIPLAGNSCNIDEYITTLPKHPSDYVDYVVSVSLAYFNGEDRRITTNKVDILIDKTAYYPETENAPEIPQSQYDAFVNDVAGYAQFASESAKKAQELAESFPESIYQDEAKIHTTITDQHVEISAGENDDSMIEMSESGIDIHANGGVSISNVVTPTQDDDAVNKKYVDDIAKQFQPGGGGGGDGVDPFYAVYDEDSYDDIVNAHHAGRPVYAVREADGIEYIAPLQSVTGSRVFFHTSQPEGPMVYWQVWKDSGTWSAGAVPYATETYVDEKVGKIELVKIVTELPETGEENKTYFVAKTDGEGADLYDEFMWINGAWEYIGTKQFDVDLTEYAKKTETVERQIVGSGAKLYGENQGGAYMYLLSNTADNFSVAQRGLGGVLAVATPTADNHATTKAYVDGLIAQLEARIKALEG